MKRKKILLLGSFLMIFMGNAIIFAMKNDDQQNPTSQPSSNSKVISKIIINKPDKKRFSRVLSGIGEIVGKISNIIPKRGQGLRPIGKKNSKYNIEIGQLLEEFGAKLEDPVVAKYLEALNLFTNIANKRKKNQLLSKGKVPTYLEDYKHAQNLFNATLEIANDQTPTFITKAAKERVSDLDIIIARIEKQNNDMLKTS